MAVELTMPKFGLTMHEGTLQRFFKAPGEGVKAGEPLYEVETEKVLYVVEAPTTGTLAAWFHGEGEIVECGRPVAIIAEAGEDAATLAARVPAGASAAAPARRSASRRIVCQPPPIYRRRLWRMWDPSPAPPAVAAP